MTQTASELRLYFAVQTTAKRLKEFADRRLRQASGVSTAQAAVLTLLHASEPITQREIARQLQQRESAVTTMISRLLNLGLIERVRSSGDQRAWALTLTVTGESALLEAMAAFQEVNELLSSVLDGREMSQLASACQRLNAALSQGEI